MMKVGRNGKAAYKIRPRLGKAQIAVPFPFIGSG